MQRKSTEKQRKADYRRTVKERKQEAERVQRDDASRQEHIEEVKTDDDSSPEHFVSENNDDSVRGHIVGDDFGPKHAKPFSVVSLNRVGCVNRNGDMNTVLPIIRGAIGRRPGLQM